MPWDGAGNFNRVHNWVNDKNAAIDITASRMDAEDDGFATGLENCVTLTGENAPSADLPMGGQKHTNVGNATARTQYLAVGQLQDGSVVYGTAGGSSNAFTLTLSPAITAYSAGQIFWFKANFTNTDAVTIDINSVGAADINKQDGATALIADDIVSGQIVNIVYDGTQFQMLSPPGSALDTSNFADVTASNTFTTTNEFQDDLTISSTDASSSSGPAIVVDRLSASPLANDNLGQYKFRGKDDGGNTVIYATINTQIRDPDQNNKEAQIYFQTMAADTLTVVSRFGADGFIFGTPSDITPGAGILNVENDIQLDGTSVLLPSTQTLIQRVYTSYTTYTSVNSAIAKDDSIPQVSEGDEIMTRSITPTSASNRLLITISVEIFATAGYTVAVFQDSTADALAASGGISSTAAQPDRVTFQHEQAAGTTSSTTFRVRVGPESGTAYVNGDSSARHYGGVLASTIVVEEYTA